MTWDVYGSYLVIVVLLVLAPGPDTMVVLKNSLASGFRGGLSTAFGIFTASVVQGSAAALGLGALVAGSQPLFQTLRWAGVAYLCYLGLQALRGAWRGDYRQPGEVPRSAVGASRRWREGFLSNITNPKVLVMYLSVVPQFIDPTADSIAGPLLFAYTVAVLGGLYQLGLLFFVHRVRAWLQRRRVRRTLDGVTGSALIGFGVALAVES